ncbi:unnamed protein product [Leptosia nina]|uniref:Uncharacterized protein n=1 Tax=Leptosia nina TaxID=320188 RepID=A0AAV1JF38_9NEOP
MFEKSALSTLNGDAAACGTSGEGRGGAQAPCSAIPYMVTKTHNASDWSRGLRRCGLAGRGAPITSLTYILREPRTPTFHEVCSSSGVVQQNRGCAIAI